MTIRSRPRFPDWQNEFEAAVIEFDPLKLPQMVEVAENAIFTRWAQLMDNTDARDEREALVDAMHILWALKDERPVGPSPGVYRNPAGTFRAG